MCALLFVGSIITIYFYSFTRALAVAPYDSVPSERTFYPLQYCLEDSDCATVRWQDCSNCSHARAVNRRFAAFFEDNLDYYQFPAGFNARYCQVLRDEGKLPAVADGQKCSVDYLEQAKVVGSKCDTLLKLCYNECEGVGTVNRKCAYDSYPSKFLEAYIEPMIADWQSKK